MKIMTWSTFLALCLGCLLPAAALADSLDPREISSEAKWAVHLDVKGLLSSRIGSHLLAMTDKEEEMAEVHAFGTIFDFDFRKDLYSVTAYGTSLAREEGVALIKGRFDKEKLMALMQTEGKQENIPYQEFVIHKWTDHGDRFFICFYKQNAVLFSNNQDLVQGALDVLAGDKDSLAQAGALKELRSLPADAFFAGAATGFGKLVGAAPEAAILQKADSVLVAIGETEGINFLDVTLSTTDETTARHVHSVLQGVIALGALLSEEAPELARFVQSAKLRLDGRKITLHETQPADELFELIMGMK